MVNQPEFSAVRGAGSARTLSAGARLRRKFLPATFAILCGVLQSGSLLNASYTFNPIFGFYSGPGGACPNGKALLVAPGQIYGTTYYGGTTDNGIVYKLQLNNDGSFSETVIYSFTGGADGGNPTAGLKMDANGALYGTASTANGGQATGVVFQLVPPVAPATTWTYNVIHSFGGNNDGADPNSSLIVGKNGSFWGTTVKGGTSGQGTVFQVTPPAAPGGMWTENVLYSFTGGADGGQPYAELAADSSNNLFGTAYTGGASNSGTVFKLAPPAKGKPAWTESTIYTFKGGADGLNPLGGLVLTPTGALIGTTYLSDNSNGDGVIFELTPSGTGYKQSVLITFDGTNGANPSDTLVPDLKGNFYGSTGGAQAGTAGNLFKLTPSANVVHPYILSVMYTFTGGVDGQAALPSVSQSLMGAVYGTTFYGGPGGAGEVFRIN